MSSSPQGEKDKSSNYSLDRDIPRASPSYEDEDEAHRGVRKVEAIHRVFGRYSKWALFIRYASPSPSSLTPSKAKRPKLP